MSPLLIQLLLLLMAQTPLSSGIHEESMEREGAPDLLYTISIPGDYDPAEKRPLVLSLHYAGHGAPYYGKAMVASIVEPAWRELGAIIVGPDCPSSSWSTPESEEALLELIRKVMDTYAIDENRIVITGYSMGGMGTWYLASRHTDLFRAAVPMAGSPRRTRLEDLSDFPLYAIHSRVDTVVPLGPTEKAIGELKERGAPATLVIVEDIPHYESVRFREPLRDAMDWLLELFQN